MGVIQTVRYKLDKQAARELVKEVADVLDEATAKARATGAAAMGSFVNAIGTAKLDTAGAAATTAFLSGLRKRFDTDLGAIRKQVQDGIAKPEEFAAKADALAQTFGQHLGIATSRIQAGKVDFAEAIAAAEAAGRDAGEKAGKALGEGTRSSPAPAEGAKQSAEDAARAFVDGIETETRRHEQRIKLAQAEGLLTPAEATRQGHDIAQAHNQGLLRGVRQFRSRGDFTPEVMGVFTDSFKKIEDGVPPPSFFERIKTRIRSQLVTVGASIATFFAARQIFRFAGDSVREFLEDDQALQSLRTQIEATGASYTDFAGQIDDVSVRLQRLGAASGGQVQTGLGQLIAVSGDVDKSVRNIGLAADFAAKHNLTFEQAIDIVGRAMVGQVMPLRQYGIEVKKGDDAVVAMAKNAAGFAQSQGPNLTRSINILKFAWSDLKSSIGEALVEAGGGTSTLDLLSTALRDGATWARAHKDEILGLTKSIVGLAAALVSSGTRAISDFVDRSIVEFNQLDLVLNKISASVADVIGWFKRLQISVRGAIAETQEFFGADKAAANSRAKVTQLREEAKAWDEQAAAIRRAADANREHIAGAQGRLQNRAEGDDPAEAARRDVGGLNRHSSAGAPAPDPDDVGGATRGAGRDDESPEDALDKRIALLTEALRFESTRTKALEELGRIEAQLKARLDAGNLSLDKRLDLEKKLLAVETAPADLLKVLDIVPATVLAEPTLKPRLEFDRPKAEAPKAPQTKSRIERILHDAGAEDAEDPLPFGEDVVETFFDNLDEYAKSSAAGIAETFESTFKQLFGGLDEETQGKIDDLEARRRQIKNALNDPDRSDRDKDRLKQDLAETESAIDRLKGEALSLGGVLANLGKGMAKSLIGEIAKMAKVKAVENVAHAIEETAKGFAALASFNPASATAHFKSAGSHVLAAAEWGLVAGGAGAAGGGEGGGGGGDRGGNRDGESRDPLSKGRQQVVFHIKGGLLNTDNQEQMDALAAGIRAVSDSDVVVRRG